MRLRPLLSVLAAALLAAATFSGPAGAQAAGVGTTLTTTKLLTAQLGENGSILDLTLVSDEAQATIDSSVATPGSFSRLALGKLSSAIAPANDLVNKTLPAFEAKNTGPTSTAIGGQTIGVGPVLSGSVVPGALTATLANGVAASGINAELSNVNVLGGVASVASVKSALGATAAGDNAAGTRGANVTDITVLDLGALLSALGIDLTSLSLTQLTGLVDSLGAQTGLGLPSSQSTLTGAVAALNAAVDDLQAAVADAPSATSDLLADVDSTTSGLLGTVGLDAPMPGSGAVLADAIAAVNAVIDDLQAQLAALVRDGLKAIENIALLRLQGVEVGVSTKAVADPAASVAAVTGKVGSVSVGNVTLPGLDLVAAADKVSGVVAQVNGAISTVLGSVSPDLANLVKISVLDKATEITSANGYTKASAGITGATAVITPPAVLKQLVDVINASTAAVDDEVSDVLTTADIAGLGLSDGVSQVTTALSLGTAMLAAPATLKVAQVLSASNYRVGVPTSRTTGGPELPRTGGMGGGTTLALAAGLAAVVALGIRRLLTAPALVPVRSRRRDR